MIGVPCFRRSSTLDPVSERPKVLPYQIRCPFGSSAEMGPDVSKWKEGDRVVGGGRQRSSRG